MTIDFRSTRTLSAYIRTRWYVLWFTLAPATLAGLTVTTRVDAEFAFHHRVMTTHRASAADTADQTAVRAAMSRFQDAWRQANAHALADLFTEDGDLIIPTGELIRGRIAIDAFYESVFTRGYKGSTTSAHVVQMRALSDELVLLDASWSIEGAIGKNGTPQPAERGILTAVLQKENGFWKITAMREQEGASSVKMGTGSRF